MSQQGGEVEQEFALSGGVQPGFGDRDQADVGIFQAGDVFDDIDQAAAETIQLVNDDDIEQPGFGVMQHSLESGALVGFGR